MNSPINGYNFLRDVRVIEVAALGPSSLGGYLADMGADVVKVEDKAGDGVRYMGNPAMGAENGPSLLHLRWNRGKRSIAIDLKSDAGKALFLEMVADADIVIEGMRAGILERLGLGYQSLCGANPRVVFCSISGMGSYGPYSAMGSHGPSFDAFGGLSAINPYALTKEERSKSNAVPVGMHAMGLYAAIGVLSALHRARATGESASIEVAAADCSAHWLPDGVDRTLNHEASHDRPGFLGGKGRQAWWPRLWRYDCKDGRGIFFQAFHTKFWDRFCKAVERPDLAAAYEADRDVNEIDEYVHHELNQFFQSRDFAEWMELFERHDIPAGAANTKETLATDAHFLARDNLYNVKLANDIPLRLTGTPIKVTGQDFAATLAPERASDSDEILRDWLGYSDEDLQAMHENGTLI